MEYLTSKRLVAGLFALSALGFGCSPPPKSEPQVSQWRPTRDGYIKVDADDSFKQITRCWDIGDGISDCVWIGGQAQPNQGHQGFSAERWFTSGHPEQGGPQRRSRQSDAYYGCQMTFKYGRLSQIDEILTLGDGTDLLTNERWLNERNTRAAWTFEDLLLWSKRTKIQLASPILDCERLGGIIESGSWEALTSNHWTAPSGATSDGLTTLGR